MWIEMSNVDARLIRATDDERRWLYEYLSFGDSTAHFRKAAGDGRIHALSLITDAFAAGFVPLVQKAAPAEGYTVEVVDKRTRIERDPAADLGWLRWYQLEAVDRVLARSRGIIWAA